MHALFKKNWSKDLIPFELELNSDGKKEVAPRKESRWKNGESYTKFPLNSIGMRTGSKTVNVIDVDTKDLTQLTEPFKSWVEERLMLEDTLTVESKNGYHFYFYSFGKPILTTAKEGADKSTVPFIDFRGEGGIIFIHSDTDFADYKVICDDAPTGDIAEILDALPEYVERATVEEVGFENLDDETDTGVTRVGEKRPLEEVIAMVNSLSPDLKRVQWMAVMTSAYKLIDSDPERLKEPLREWSRKGETFNTEKFNKDWKEIATGGFGKNYGAGTLVKLSREADNKAERDAILSEIEKADSQNALDKIITQISKIEFMSDRDGIAECMNARLKELKKDNSSIKVAQARTIIKELKYRPTVEELEEKGDGVDMAVYLRGNFYCLRVKNTVVEDITEKTVKSHCYSLGINPMISEAYINKAKAIAGIKKETDYMLKTRAGFELQHSGAVHELRYLHLLTNPLSSIQEPAEREDIIKDFFEDIWHGKAEDIIRLIGLTMRFKETKLNKIHVVAPSNTGKTTFLENIGFQTIHMKRLVQALNADKGIGKPVIDGLKSSGFLLIDETNDPLTQDIKNIDNYISLDQFGQGGTQEIKLHFTCMTSTHKSAVRGMSDEMYNRMLLIELKKDESKFTIDKSELFVHDTEAYTETLIQHTKWMLKDALTNPKYTKKDLNKLQEKYRLELNNDVDEMLLEVSGKVMEEFKTLATAEGDVVERNGDYFIRRRTDVHDAIANRLGEYSHIDQGKYGDELMSHFLSDERKKIRISGKPVNFYKFKMKKYYANDEQEIVDMFDDLDAEEL